MSNLAKEVLLTAKAEDIENMLEFLSTTLTADYGCEWDGRDKIGATFLLITSKKK